MDLATQRSCALTRETWWTGVEGERGVLTQGFKMSEFIRREVGWGMVYEVGKQPYLRGYQGKTGQRTTVFQYEQGENVPGGGWGPWGLRAQRKSFSRWGQKRSLQGHRRG